MKTGTFINTSFLPSAQSTGIFCYLWNFVCEQLEGDTVQGLTVDGNVEGHGGLTMAGQWERLQAAASARPSSHSLIQLSPCFYSCSHTPPHSTLYKPVRVVILTQKSDHVPFLLRTLKWLPPIFGILSKVLLLAHQGHQTLALTSLSRRFPTFLSSLTLILPHSPPCWSLTQGLILPFFCMMLPEVSM